MAGRCRQMPSFERPRCRESASRICCRSNCERVGWWSGAQVGKGTLQTIATSLVVVPCSTSVADRRGLATEACKTSALRVVAVLLFLVCLTAVPGVSARLCWWSRQRSSMPVARRSSTDQASSGESTAAVGADGLWSVDVCACRSVVGRRRSQTGRGSGDDAQERSVSVGALAMEPVQGVDPCAWTGRVEVGTRATGWVRGTKAGPSVGCETGKPRRTASDEGRD
ncbi:uncharacterized protein PSFLO_01178 [Pseudozyma flocculosa]|uniref:Uncharacterized protein n=1 Tax=Pseudozyma flocculosa TaxID=84751 RepID=A0A5C3EW80_9BASI|nr:uncharacterized protein PSFLO_01178 [Pseudozyma flocculosa]